MWTEFEIKWDLFSEVECHRCRFSSSISEHRSSVQGGSISVNVISPFCSLQFSFSFSSSGCSNDASGCANDIEVYICDVVGLWLISLRQSDVIFTILQSFVCSLAIVSSIRQVYRNTGDWYVLRHLLVRCLMWIWLCSFEFGGSIV